MKELSFAYTTIPANVPAIQACYEQNGIVCIQQFLNPLLLSQIKTELLEIEEDALLDLKANWQNQKVCFFSRNANKEAIIKNDFANEPYFLQSRNKAHLFYEKMEDQWVINRIGHGMHLMEKYQIMQQIVYQNPNLHELLKLAGLRRPICHLSVYIPKEPTGNGSHVRPHQESTFAYTEPQSVNVLWIALEDARIDNACMWGVLGSNKYPLKYVSLVDHVNKTREFKQVNGVHIPDFDKERNKFTALEVQAGDALFFHGNFIHCSATNFSNRSRKALSMQFIDTLDVRYAKTNWIQPPNNKYIF